MSPVAHRVDVAEDRLDRIERMVEQFAADTARFRAQADHEAWDRDRRAMNMDEASRAVRLRRTR